ncbi:MAG: hypothetical protein JW793_11885 [Acidobacteria bacterium]|nr:hypothetical protein [Acidobacteriota bacterium]
MSTAQDSKSIRCDPDLVRKELLFALETARSRLAIAIAEESKSTPWALRRHYLDTSERMRQCITKLRNGENHKSRLSQDWLSALDQLRGIDLSGGARPICSRLDGIVSVLE